MFVARLKQLFGRKSGHPLFAENRRRFRSFDYSRPIEECEFVVLDTELTGLNPRKDEIVSVGAVRIRNMSIQAHETFYSLVQPKTGLPKTSTLIHRITPQEIQSAPRLRTILPDLVRFIGPAFLVGHHIGMDMAFLNRAARTVFGEPLVNPCLDTMRMARIYRAEQWENYYDRYDLGILYDLETLSIEYGLPRFGAHNALNDAMQAAYLFLFLVRKLKGGGIVTLKDLYEAGRSWRWYL